MIPDDSVNHQVPSSMVAAEFGEVNVLRTGSKLRVSFTILAEPDGVEAEGYQTGVALDASASMKSVYGLAMQGRIPPEVMEEYRNKGWLRQKFVDGRESLRLDSAAETDAVTRGFLKRSPNSIEPTARDFIRYLADRLDEDGGTTVIYWACGPAGADTEVLGDVTSDECDSLIVSGPKRMKFG
ncbi:MAG: VWA domain-containing protein, partial [Planctomycetes bacterium]|nr:VWA domain-containing protein [Planctomycetota bacterium]